MERQELEVVTQALVQSLEDGHLERHEVHARLRQNLDQMRAFGMPLPQDLVDLEEALAGEFETEAGAK